MRILFSFHMYPPVHRAGAEYFAHNLAKKLIANGHEVRVLLHRYWGSPDIDKPYEYEGVMVWPPISTQALDELFFWSDIVCSHLDFFKHSAWRAKLARKPIVFFAHSISHYYDDTINRYDHTYVVYNAFHVRDELKLNRPSCVVQPFVDPECLAESNTKEYITLVNLCELKGGEQFYELARRMPDKKFLGVTGSYNEQLLEQLPNVTIWPRSNIKDVFSVTKVILMPSSEESWGMVAAEALFNGIPVLCSPTPGLIENCGDSAQYFEREDLDGYENAIRKLDKPTTYGKWVKKALERTKNRLILEQLQDFENLLIRAVNECKSNT